MITRYIYILKLQDRKDPSRELFYVGRTKNPDSRISDHFNQTASCAWTNKYKPIEVVKRFKAKSYF